MNVDLAEDIPLCLKYTDKIKLNMFILLLFYCWLQVSASQDHQQANIYNKIKNAGEYNTKTYIFYGKR